MMKFPNRMGSQSKFHGSKPPTSIHIAIENGPVEIVDFHLIFPLKIAIL